MPKIPQRIDVQKWAIRRVQAACIPHAITQPRPYLIAQLCKFAFKVTNFLSFQIAAWNQMLLTLYQVATGTKRGFLRQKNVGLAVNVSTTTHNSLLGQSRITNHAGAPTLMSRVPITYTRFIGQVLSSSPFPCLGAENSFIQFLYRPRRLQ